MSSSTSANALNVTTEQDDSNEHFQRMSDHENLGGFPLFFHQLKAIFYKKSILFTRNKLSLIGIIFLPVILTSLGIKFDLRTRQSPRLNFTLDRFPADLVFPVFYEENGSRDLLDAYREMVRGKFGTVVEHKIDPPKSTSPNGLLKIRRAISETMHKEKYMFGIFQTSSAIYVFFHDSVEHSERLAIQLALDAWVHRSLGKSFSVQTGVQHFPCAVTKRFSAMQIGTLLAFGFSMALMPVIFIYPLISERAEGARHLQALSGVSPMAYWLGTFLFDMITYLVSISILMVALQFYPGVYVAQTQWVLTLLVRVTFSMATFPYLYVVQLLFKSPSRAMPLIAFIDKFAAIFIGTVSILLMYSVPLTFDRLFTYMGGSIIFQCGILHFLHHWMHSLSPSRLRIDSRYQPSGVYRLPRPNRFCLTAELSYSVPNSSPHPHSGLHIIKVEQDGRGLFRSVATARCKYLQYAPRTENGKIVLGRLEIIERLEADRLRCRTVKWLLSNKDQPEVLLLKDDHDENGRIKYNSVEERLEHMAKFDSLAGNLEVYGLSQVLEHHVIVLTESFKFKAGYGTPQADPIVLKYSEIGDYNGHFDLVDLNSVQWDVSSVRRQEENTLCSVCHTTIGRRRAQICVGCQHKIHKKCCVKIANSQMILCRVCYKDILVLVSEKSKLQMKSLPKTTAEKKATTSAETTETT